MKPLFPVRASICWANLGLSFFFLAGPEKGMALISCLAASLRRVSIIPIVFFCPCHVPNSYSVNHVQENNFESSDRSLFFKSRTGLSFDVLWSEARIPRCWPFTVRLISTEGMMNVIFLIHSPCSLRGRICLDGKQGPNRTYSGSFPADPIFFVCFGDWKFKWISQIFRFNLFCIPAAQVRVFPEKKKKNLSSMHCHRKPVLSNQMPRDSDT